tara:strand:- start:310 stop:1533 length:1224 start_codon:yes stop_codon:yes gene_type:complete
MGKEIEQRFKKYYNMEPYINIPHDEWQSILKDYEKDDIIDELAKVLHTYKPPIQKITEQDTIDALKKLKSTWWNDILLDGVWFPRNDTKSDYDLRFLGEWKYFKRVNAGNNASNPFHIENRWKVDWVRMPSGWKTWQTEKGIKTIIRAYFSLEKVLTEVNENTLRMATTLRKYIASQFKPSIAKAFYDYFGSNNVLDFSAGWGDRLAGFYCGETTKSYVGIDPNTNNHPNYQRQVEFYKKHQTFFEQEKKVDLIPLPAEDVDFTKYKEHFDTVFTSPPYFNTEKYSEHDTQSFRRYSEIDSWNKDFLHKALGNIIPAMKTGGILAVNIADVYCAKKKGYLDICNPMNDFIKSQGLKYRGCIGMEMTKRFNSAGAGKAASDYFSDDFQDKALDTKNDAFGEPIWIWEK